MQIDYQTIGAKMHKSLLLTTILALTSCAQWHGKLAEWNLADPVPVAVEKPKAIKIKESERVLKYEFPTGVTAQEGFHIAKKWFAKNLNNSNHTIKMENEKTNEIISKFGISCGREDLIMMTVELNFKNNKARGLFEGISSNDAKEDGDIQDYGFYPNTIEQLESFKLGCLDPVVEDLKSALAKKEDW